MHTNYHNNHDNNNNDNNNNNNNNDSNTAGLSPWQGSAYQERPGAELPEGPLDLLNLTH